MSDLSYKNPLTHLRRAKALRRQGTLVERLLWNALSAMRSETDIKFRRQHPLHPYIADFACVKARLVVELEGVSHDVRQIYDAKRDDDLINRGWTILRFANQEVENNLEGVVLTIVDKARALIGPPSFPPVKTGGRRVRHRQE